MPIECLATELGAKGDFKHIHFKDLGALYIDYAHTFSTEILEDKLPEEAVRKKRSRKPNIDEKQTLIKLLKEHFSKEQITAREKPFRVLNIHAKISDMLEFIQQERDKALQLQIRNSELKESEKAELRNIWHSYKDKINALKKVRRETKEESAQTELDAIIKHHKDNKHKASYTLANKIVTGHYTEMIRWENSHPWSYYEISSQAKEALEQSKKIQEELQQIRADAEKRLGSSTKRTLTDMNKFFQRAYGTKDFSKIHKRKFAEHLGPDIISRRTEIQKQINTLQGQIKDIGRIDHKPNDQTDEIKVILDSERHIQFKRYIDAEEILGARWCFIDIEKPRFDTPKEEVSWVAITYYENKVLKKEIHTSKKTGEEFKQRFLQEKNCEIIDHYKNENWLMAGVQASINAMDPKILCSYNTPYDFVELDKTEHGLEYGIRKSRAKKEVTTRFFERIDIKDKLVIDPLPIMKTAKKFLPNKKLAMIAQELRLNFKKSINYKMMAELEDIIDGKPLEEVSEKTKAKIKEFTAGREETQNLKEVCAQIIAHYVGDDVEILPELIFHPEMQNYLKHIGWIAKFADVNFQKAAHTPNSVNNLQKKDFFEKTGTHLDTIHKRTKALQRAENRIRRFVKKTKQGEKDKQKNKTLRGLHKNIAHLVIPSWPFLKADLEHRFPAAKKLFEYLESNKENSQEYYFLSQYADAFCKYLLHAWGTYIKARDELDARIQKAGKNFHKIDQACLLCKELLQDTHDKDQLRKAYVNMKTLESMLDSSADIKEYYRPAEKQDPVIEKEAKNIIRKNIRKINQILQDQQLEPHNLQHWLNKWLSTAKKRNSVTAPFNADPENIEILEFEQKLINLETALRKAKIKTIHKKDENVFLAEQEAKKLPEDVPAIKVDRHDKAYIAEDTETKSGNRIYYPKHGFYGGIKVKDDEPSNHLTLFEMRAYGGFLAYLFNGYIDQAVTHLLKERGRFKGNSVPKKELLFYIKKHNAYEAFVKGERIRFRTSTQQKTRYDVKYRMHYTEEYNKKGEPSRVYITPIEEIKLDRAKYSARIEERIRKLITPIQKDIQREKRLMPAVLERSYPQDSNFENWKKEGLKQSPFDLAKKALQEGRTLNSRALDIFSSYRIYRSGFRADFENEEIQCAKAHWAMNEINNNSERNRHITQTIVPSSRRGFHIVTESGHPAEPRYKCTCEHNRIRKRECSHIRQTAA